MIDIFRKFRSQQYLLPSHDSRGLSPSLSFLRLGIYPACYWRDRNDRVSDVTDNAKISLGCRSREVIGLGCAAEFRFASLSEIREFLYEYENLISSFKNLATDRVSSTEIPEHGVPPIFVVIPFDCNSHSSTFKVPARIIIPQTAIVRNVSSDNSGVVTFYSADENFDIANAALSQINSAPLCEPYFSEFFLSEPIREQIDIPSWKKEFSRLKMQFSLAELLKVVLAHQFIFQNNNSLGLSQLLRRNESFGDDNRFRFLLASSESLWLYSKSPERLLSIDGKTLRSEALGGTTKLGDPEPSERILREHAAIVDQIDHDFKNLGILPQWGAFGSENLNLGTIRHLWHPVEGKVSAEMMNTDILFTLHPTPAVCGFPKHKAS